MALNQLTSGQLNSTQLQLTTECLVTVDYALKLRCLRTGGLREAIESAARLPCASGFAACQTTFLGRIDG